MTVIRGESCFEKTHLKIQKTPPAHQNSTFGERISREIFEIFPKKKFALKLFLWPILFHGKTSFDNLTYFKLYGNLKETSVKRNVFILFKTDSRQLRFFRNKKLRRKDGSEPKPSTLGEIAETLLPLQIKFNIKNGNKFNKPRHIIIHSSKIDVFLFYFTGS